MNYAQFKAYLSRFVWRDGDADFDAELDNFVTMAHSRLNRDLRIQDMSTSVDLSVAEDSVALPSDYLQLRTVSSNTSPSPLSYVTPQRLEQIRASFPTRFAPYYSIAGKSLLFAGASVDEGRSVKVTYYAKVPDFVVTDASWLVEDYLDLYTYAVLRHTASYLRDDERVALWKNEYDESLAAVMGAEIQERYSGSPLVMPLPGQVA